MCISPFKVKGCFEKQPCVRAGTPEHPATPQQPSRPEGEGVVAFLGATCRQQPSPHPHARSSLFVLRHGRHSYVSGLQECPHAAPLEAGLSRPLLFVSTSPAASGQHTRQNRQRSDRTRRHNIELPHARGVCRLKKKKQRGVQEAMHSGIGTIQAPWPLPHGLTSAVSKKRCPHAAAPRRSSRPLLFFSHHSHSLGRDEPKRRSRGIRLLTCRRGAAPIEEHRGHRLRRQHPQHECGTAEAGCAGYYSPWICGRPQSGAGGVSGSRFAFWMHAAQPTSLKFCPHGGLRSKAVITAAATKPLPGRYM